MLRPGDSLTILEMALPWASGHRLLSSLPSLLQGSGSCPDGTVSRWTHGLAGRLRPWRCVRVGFAVAVLGTEVIDLRSEDVVAEARHNPAPETASSECLWPGRSSVQASCSPLFPFLPLSFPDSV